MTDDATLGGYLAQHDRPPAFAGVDGRAYSVDLYVDEDPGEDGRYGAAILFVRWSEAGDQPDGHVETEYLAYGVSAMEAQRALHSLTLYELKALLDRAVTSHPGPPDW